MVHAEHESGSYVQQDVIYGSAVQITGRCEGERAEITNRCSNTNQMRTNTSQPPPLAAGLAGTGFMLLWSVSLGW